MTSDISIWSFVLIAFGSGLAAILTPCVFPIIPLTVSYFSKGAIPPFKSERRSRGAFGLRVNRGMLNGVFFGLSIILIYVLVGTAVAKINGPAFANWLSTHWLPNILFFIIFFVFALSFLGMFEISLPSSWVNKADEKSDKGGLETGHSHQSTPMRTIGLIGGMSWRASMQHYQIMNQSVNRRPGKEHSAEIILKSLDLQPMINAIGEYTIPPR